MDPILLKLSDSLASARTLEDLTRPLLEMLQAVTNLESTYLTQVDAQRELQHVLFSRNSQALQIPENLSVPWGDTLCKRALEEDRMYTDNVAEHWSDSEAARQLGIRTYVSTPIRLSDGELYGTLCAASGRSAPMQPGAEQVLKLFAKLIGQHVERENLLKELQEKNETLASMALTDILTGLPNRRAILSELERLLARAVRTGTSVLVGFVDLDGFKRVNDELGHDAGDALLRAMGQRLEGALRKEDMLARFGGDEFLLAGPGWAPADGDEALVEQLRQRIAKATAGTIDLGLGQQLEYAGASVGLINLDARGADAQLAVTKADEAMYRIKAARRAAAD